MKERSGDLHEDPEVREDAGSSQDTTEDQAQREHDIGHVS